MKSIVFSVAFLVVWITVSHFFPTINLIFAFLAYPSLFIGLSFLFKNSINSYFLILFYFSIILGNDFLFRLYGGGILDDAGRGWCELVFYMTLITSTIALFVVKIRDRKLKEGDKFVAGKIAIDVSFVLVFSVITFLIFRNYNIFIIR